MSKSAIHRDVSAEARIKKTVAISPAVSMLKGTPRGIESQYLQTPMKCVDFNHTTQNSFDTNLFSTDRQTQYNYIRSLDHETTVTPKSSLMRDDLQEEIKKWFEDIPIYPNLTSSMKNLRRNMINEFTDKIFDLSNDVTADDYERNVKAEVDNFLNALPMWYPGAKRDQDLLKEGIKNNLLKKIKCLSEKSNNKAKSVKYVDDMVNTDNDMNLNNDKSIKQIDIDDKEKIIESEVLDWLMQIKFKESDDIGRTINIIDATDIFTKRLMPLLDKPSGSKNYKLILKGLIVDTLNDLPNVLLYPKNKRLYLNRIAEDLANRLISVQLKYQRSLNCCFPRERSMYQLAVCSKSSLKKTILDGLNECLQSVNVNQRNDVKEEITDILIDCLESVRFKEDLEDKDELINNVLGNRSFEISETQTSDITIENVRDMLAEDIINTEYDEKNLEKSYHSGTTSVFTSEHEMSGKYPITSTPKQKGPIIQETVKLNKEEITYMDRVGLLIRNWMETLPRKFDEEEEKSFKEVMINDLAGDIMDQLKLEQLAPKTSPDRDKFMFYIIFRWLFRFEVYDELSDATPQVENLVKRLHEIPVPTLTMPQRGNRQAMDNVKHMEGDLGWKKEFVPKSSDILEDEISIWMNEQPSDIYSVKDKDYQNKMVHELAGTVKNKINNSQQGKELDSDLAKWLRIMLKSSEKNKIDILSQSLKDRLSKLPKNYSPSDIDIKQQTYQNPVTSPSNSSESVRIYPKVTDAKNYGSEASSPKNSSKNKKNTVSNFSYRCPREPKDSNTSESELSLDAKPSKNKQGKKTTPKTKTNVQTSSDLSKEFKNVGKKKMQNGKNSCPSTSSRPKISTPATDKDIDRTLIEFIGKYMERNYDVDDNMAKGAFGEILKTEFRKLDPPTRKEVYDNFAKDKIHDEFSPERLGKELQYIKDISDWLKNIPIEGSFNTPQNQERIDFVNGLARNIYEIEENRRNEPSAMDYNSYLVSTIAQSTEKLPILPEHAENIPLMVDQLVAKVIASRTPMPCCMNFNRTTSSMNSTGIPEQSISEFIDNYIRLNAGEIANDPVKLDAWSARVLKEAKKIIRNSADPSTLCKTQIYDKLGNISIPEEESIRLFGLELDYAKEISEWLNNLPLLPITTPEASEQRVRMISELAEKFAEREKNKIANPTETKSDKEIVEYVNKWIYELPLDSNKEIMMPVITQQLLNRIERVNRGPQDTLDQSTNTPRKAKPKAKSKTCRPSCCSTGGKAGQLVVEAIETWSNNLPIKAENKDAEKSIKDDVARKLFQKVGDLSIDPQVMNDDLLYQEMLSDEVDQQLNVLPQSSDLQKKRECLKKSIVDKVIEAKSLAKESAAGESYKEQLETTIDASIPNPVYNRQVYEPGFEIYKNRLAEIFILENFDHGNDDVKLKYEKRIKKEIEKYCQDALMRNAVPLSKEQIYSELYGALFKVPIPCDSSTAEEVEEVKTRCEIAEWFEDLPFLEVTCGDELLKRDRIQSMLAKRLREIEKKEQKPDEKMRKEITKWITKLPLQPGNESNVNKLADDLQNKLKSTKQDRKRVSLSEAKAHTSKTEGILGTSQIAGPSSAGQMWSSPPLSSQICCLEPQIPRKKAADVILEIVENWCQSLPFYENTQKSRDMNKVIREDLGTKIIIKICELNGDPQTFSNDSLYNYFLDEELEKLMVNLPICCDFKPTKDYKKGQLKEAINSVKPLIREERARHEYKKELNATVNTVLKEPLDTTADKITLFNELREEIVDNFVQYHYNRDDDEGKQIYKAKLRDAVLKYFLEIQDKADESGVDPLIKQNQLMCELAKISIPNERALKDQVEEIRMKEAVNHFFEEHSLNEEPEEKMAAVNNIKLSLAKRLNEIEKSGHNCTNDAKMKKEISRYLQKIDKDVKAEEIRLFVNSLKATEAARKTPPVKKDDPSSRYPNRNHSYPNQNGALDSSRPASKLCCPQAYSDGRSLGVTPVEYQGFDGGVALSSSPRQPEDMANVGPNRNQTPERNLGEGSDGRFTANKRKIQKTDNDGTEDKCNCLAGKERRKMRGRPRCVLRRPQFCDDCDEYGPMWMPMPPMPPYRYPPGYFYY